MFLYIYTHHLKVRKDSRSRSLPFHLYDKEPYFVYDGEDLNPQWAPVFRSSCSDRKLKWRTERMTICVHLSKEQSLKTATFFSRHKQEAVAVTKLSTFSIAVIMNILKLVYNVRPLLLFIWLKWKLKRFTVYSHNSKDQSVLTLIAPTYFTA